MQGFLNAVSQSLYLAAGSALVLLLVGYLWTHVGRLSHNRMAGQAAVLASVLALLGIGFAPKLGIAQGRTWLDGMVLFWVIWFHCYFMCWGGMFLGKRQQHAKKATPSAFGFRQSSILSMQYMDSREHDDATLPPDRGILETKFQESNSGAPAPKPAPGAVPTGAPAATPGRPAA